MPYFRPALASAHSETITAPNLRTLIAEMVRPAHFFVGSDLTLRWDFVASEEQSWEIFQGRLLDAAHTRLRRSFPTWNVALVGEGKAEEPLLAVKLDAEAEQLHVVRGLDSYVWEGYDAGGNVYLSRERRKWVRELVASIPLSRFTDLAELRDELACQLFRAVIGTSRLPLSSLEAPLPAFSFGQLFYCYRPEAPPESDAVRGWRGLLSDMLSASLNPREQAHWLQTFLHVVPQEEMRDAAVALHHRFTEIGWTSADLLALLRRLYNEVSLSPYTNLVDKTLLFLRCLEAQAVLRTDQVVDFLSYLLRHIGRHLTAYDLVLFHHRGANYPDALLLDAVLKEYLARIESRTELFIAVADDNESAVRQKRIRRRALRQGWLLRRRYEGHAVPDLPTSPGENTRVLPASHPRVPDEQITQPARRQRCLYDHDSLLPRLRGPIADLLHKSMVDLEHIEEWREMGLAVYLDRPLGVGKAATEPDGTLLLSAEAFSPSIALQRLLALARELNLSPDHSLVRHPEHHAITGLPLDAIGDAARPGTVTLSDARRVAADFVFLRSTASSVRAFLRQFDFSSLAAQYRVGDVLNGADILIARALKGPGLVLYDAQLRPRVELEVITEKGFTCRAGEEYPAGGLQVMMVAELAPDRQALQIQDVRKQRLYLLPCG